jgi:tRNA1Val (adenine37-N6)-methyltransferase
MANTYFQFKQFKIEQKHCANKVSTDACVFGAWMARLIKSGIVLDVGAGSGLLSLMIGQQHKAAILGIELEEDCVRQAEDNISASPFGHIQIRQADIRTWQSTEKFDWLISNPPFFNNSSKNEDVKKNLARQTESLGPKDWATILSNCGYEETKVALLLSNNDVLASYEENLKNSGFGNQKKILLLDTETAECKRVILFAKKEAFQLATPSSFIYKNQDGSYANEFIELMKDYYLYL